MTTKRPAGRLQAEAGKMLRGGLLVFGLVWFALFAFIIPSRGDVEVLLFFCLPGGIVNIVSLVVLMVGYTRAWGVRPEDARSAGGTKRSLVVGGWMLMASLVLYVAGAFFYHVGPSW